MSGKVKITQRSKYVLVEAEGEPLSPDEIKSTLSQALKIAIKFSLNLMIAREEFVKQSASTVDFYYYAELIAESEFMKKLALVFPKDMHYDNLGFFETTSRNRGINFRLFSSKDDALEWISSDTD